MIRFALLVGLCGLGCVGTVSGEPEDVRPSDVVGPLTAISDQRLGQESAVAEKGDPEVSETVPAEAAPHTEPTPNAVDPAPHIAEPAPYVTPQAPEPTPNVAPAPGCVAVPAGGWVCAQACVASWPVPSAVQPDGSLSLYTAEGRQLCGDVWGRTLSDGCGHSVQIDIHCPGNDLCAGEGVWNEDGTLSEERYLCAECRVAEDSQGQCGGERPILVKGCRTVFAGCTALGAAGQQCCATEPLSI